MSKEYLRQETLEPAKALGKHAGMGIGGAMVISLGAFFVVLGSVRRAADVAPGRGVVGSPRQAHHHLGVRGRRRASRMEDAR